MKHLFIVNPAAGKKGSTQQLLRQIEELGSSRALNRQVVLTQKAGDAEAIARAAAREGEPLRIYACGGDGTLNEVVNGAAGVPDVAVTNVPKGTGNDFLRIFGPNARERFADLSALVDGPQAAMDLMECNGKLGLGVICAGVDARIAADVHRYKSLPLVTGIGAYILSLIENVLFKGISRPATVDMGPVHTSGEVSVICICNGRYYGGGFMPVGDAQPDDGVLDMLLVPKVSRLTFFRLVGKYAKGRYREYPHLITDYHGQSITFSSPDGMVAVVDGEVMEDTSFTVSLSEKKLDFFYPAGLNYRAEISTPTAAL